MANKHNKLILKFLLSNKKDEFTIRAIAKETHIDYKAAYLTTKELVENRLIKAKRAGQTVLCSINQKEFNEDVFRAELLRKEELLRNKDLHVLYDYFKDIKEPFFILLLFGSYANQKYRKGSDIDLMLISDDENIKKLIESKVSIIPLKIHLVRFTSKEFISMLKTTEFNVGREAFNNNVILFGIEDYYRLIKNA